MLHRQKMLIAKHQDSNLFNNIKSEEKICAMEFRLLCAGSINYYLCHQGERERKNLFHSLKLNIFFSKYKSILKQTSTISFSKTAPKTNKKPPPQNLSTFSLSCPGFEFCIGVAGREQNLHYNSKICNI